MFGFIKPELFYNLTEKFWPILKGHNPCDIISEKTKLALILELKRLYQWVCVMTSWTIEFDKSHKVKNKGMSKLRIMCLFYHIWKVWCVSELCNDSTSIWTYILQYETERIFVKRPFSFFLIKLFRSAVCYAFYYKTHQKDNWPLLSYSDGDFSIRPVQSNNCSYRCYPFAPSFSGYL